jgi:hypothetical protein
MTQRGLLKSVVLALFTSKARNVKDIQEYLIERMNTGDSLMSDDSLLSFSQIFETITMRVS